MSQMTITHGCVIALLFWEAAAAQTSSVPDIWGPVRSLVGTWEGEVNGQPGSGKSVRECRFVLNDKYLEIRNKSTYPVQPKNPKGEVHEDWGMISYDRSRKKLVLRQFHVEGFVNQYAAEPVREGMLRFTSETIENIPAGYRARETYTIIGPNEFVERFELAEPGKDFELYCETRFRRRQR
jgi:hypothetical protein